MEQVIASEKATLVAFEWLIERLLSPSEKIMGCEVILPETIFYA
jgi:hypothetical protein